MVTRDILFFVCLCLVWIYVHSIVFQNKCHSFCGRELCSRVEKNTKQSKIQCKRKQSKFFLYIKKKKKLENRNCSDDFCLHKLEPRTNKINAIFFTFARREGNESSLISLTKRSAYILQYLFFLKDKATKATNINPFWKSVPLVKGAVYLFFFEFLLKTAKGNSPLKQTQSRRHKKRHPRFVQKFRTTWLQRLKKNIFHLDRLSF